jgi:hypothetical protein
VLDARGAAERRKTLQKEREEAYGRLFDAVISEQQALADLYTPLMTRLAASSGTLQKLSFTVSRAADISGWANFGEGNLIDCRKAGPFFGRGSLAKVVTADLKPARETGSASGPVYSMTSVAHIQMGAEKPAVAYPAITR